MEQKKKLVYILHNMAIGGVEVALLSAIPDLNKRYHLKVIVLGRIDPKTIAPLSEEEREVFKVFDYPHLLLLLRLGTIVRYILDFAPDMMISSLWRASLVACATKVANKKIRFFAFNHNTRFGHVLQKIFIKMAARKADVILTDCVATTNFVQTFGAEAPIYEVSFLTDPTPDLIVREAPQLNKPVNFMFLGRISPVKNIPLIIEVISYLRSRSIPAVLDIYGRNDGTIHEAEKLIEQLELKDAVHFKGEIESSARKALFPHYHFYIQLSSWEGMAMSVAEAMQHGLVCIVSPVGEIVNYAKDMESGIFIDINRQDWQQDIKKILQVLHSDHLYNQLSAAGRQTFVNRKRYSESLIDRLEGVLR